MARTTFSKVHVQDRFNVYSHGRATTQALFPEPGLLAPNDKLLRKPPSLALVGVAGAEL